MAEEKEANITLFYREGTSDKVYRAELLKKGAQWVVNAAWGRRGATMQTGTKTAQPVDYAKARKIYDSLVREKTGKGYTEDTSGKVFTSHTTADQQDTGRRPQLLNEVEEAEIERLIKDSSYYMQEKKDGKRVILHRDAGEDAPVVASNRKGLTIGIPQSVERHAQKVAGPWTIDGELVGETFWAFDLLDSKGEDHRGKPYYERYGTLSVVTESLRKESAGPIRLVVAIADEDQKRAAFEGLKQSKAEGVVFKKKTAAYTAGRPASGGNQLKFKFYETVSVVVQKQNDKRSVAMQVLDGNELVGVGNVTIPPNKEIPKPGTIIEVRYLYAYPTGSLYQPTYIGPRDDLDRSDCQRSQLKFREPNEEDEVPAAGAQKSAAQRKAAKGRTATI